ncbi:MAG TPA: Rad52/Rad22 family DNA repair protein, partial [Xanthomonadaceae bacterium]|nr:Rad52/Rad22 family DNA repair protein [Xanthomonadaceae bacterium]
TNEKRKKPDDPFRGQPLCYVDARTVMDRLDSVCGADGWQCSYSAGVGSSIVCNIGIRLAGDWLWKADGAGATDMEADKGALSDAFKRAAVRWGIGRYLYEVKAPWLELDERKNIREADHARLRTLHEEYARKAGWGDETGAMAYRLLLADLKRMPPEARDEFVRANMALIDRMPVQMRKHLLQQAKA